MPLTKYEKDLINEVNQKWFADPPRDVWGALEAGWSPFTTIEHREFSSRTSEEKLRLIMLKKLCAKGKLYWNIDFDSQKYEFYPISVAEEKVWRAPLNK